MASVSLWDVTIGKGLNFIITSGDGVLDLTGALGVTMHVNNGRTYPMEILSALSATVRYVVSANDFPTERRLLGQLVVSFGAANQFPTSTFEIIVRKSIQKC